ncbi:(2Fe-2S)-binding protein [Peribacillus alkalitolerans]|uniref:(2Fe-2S)-binding protein n=1 Tax=Peribacillus alkalitolerans TaxID=1550385 RepID=UPI0013D7762D|nr:(2Fe-2S)-binding protein [Peribacillus alkalitolerans]
MWNRSIIICRCEEVLLEEIELAILEGACTTQELKMATRAGMGICQGRICRLSLESLVPPGTKEFLESPSQLTIHLPVRPVSLSKILRRET